MKCLSLCLLAKQRKLSQFKNFNFNSLANIHGRAIGAANTGLYAIEEGTTDNGTVIPWELTLCSTDFGVRNAKKLRRIYLGLKMSADLIITVSADDSDPFSYTIPFSEYKQGRATQTIRQDMRGKYWTIKLSSTGKFALDYVGVLPIPLTETRTF